MSVYYHATHADDLNELLSSGITPTDGRDLGTRGVFATKTYDGAQEWATYFAHANTHYSRPIDRNWVIVSLKAPSGASVIEDTNESDTGELDRLLEPDDGVLIETDTALPVNEVVGMTRDAWEHLSANSGKDFSDSDEFRIHSERR